MSSWLFSVFSSPFKAHRRLPRRVVPTTLSKGVAAAILNVAKGAKGVELVKTRYGPRYLCSMPWSEDWWCAWQEHRDVLKDLGFGIYKDEKAKYEVSWRVDHWGVNQSEFYELVKLAMQTFPRAPQRGISLSVRAAQFIAYLEGDKCDWYLYETGRGWRFMRGFYRTPWRTEVWKECGSELKAWELSLYQGSFKHYGKTATAFNELVDSASRVLKDQPDLRADLAALKVAVTIRVVSGEAGHVEVSCYQHDINRATGFAKSLSDAFIPLFDSQPLSVEKAAQAILTLLDKHYGDGRMYLYSKRHYDREGKRRSIRVMFSRGKQPKAVLERLRQNPDASRFFKAGVLTRRKQVKPPSSPH